MKLHAMFSISIKKVCLIHCHHHPLPVLFFSKIISKLSFFRISTIIPYKVLGHATCSSPDAVHSNLNIDFISRPPWVSGKGYYFFLYALIYLSINTFSASGIHIFLQKVSQFRSNIERYHGGRWLTSYISS